MINVNIEWDVLRDVPKGLWRMGDKEKDLVHPAAIKHGKLGSPLAMEFDRRGKSSKTRGFFDKIRG